MQDIHIHLHPGVDPEAARAAVEAARGGRPPADGGDAHQGAAPEAGKNGAPPEADEDKIREYVERAYLDSWGSAKPLLEYLADNPDRLIPYTEISHALGYPTPRSLPGLLGAFGRRAQHRYGGFKPFEASEIDHVWHMKMRPEVAEIINSLR